MKKKILFLFIIFFLLSGCEINYDLEISSDNFIESTKILEADYSRFYSSEPAKRFYDNYSILPIPLSYYVPIPTNVTDVDSSEIDEKGYYEAEDLSSDSFIGMKYVGKFSSNNIMQSRFINNGAPKFSYEKIDNNIKMSTGSLEREFKQLPTLDKIIVNIKVNDYLVVKNNADKNNGKTYTWNITRDNYLNKTIELELSKSSKIKYTSTQLFKFWNNIPNKEMLLVLIGIIITSAVIYSYLRKKQTTKNKF